MFKNTSEQHPKWKAKKVEVIFRHSRDNEGEKIHLNARYKTVDRESIVQGEHRVRISPRKEGGSHDMRDHRRLKRKVFETYMRRDKLGGVKDNFMLNLIVRNITIRRSAGHRRGHYSRARNTKHIIQILTVNKNSHN